MSRAISVNSCSRVGGFVAALMEAIDSLAASIGPPGSASVIAIPATKGARTTRTQSSSEKSAFVVMVVSLQVTTSSPGRFRGCNHSHVPTRDRGTNPRSVPAARCLDVDGGDPAAGAGDDRDRRLGGRVRLAVHGVGRHVDEVAGVG